MRYAGVPLEEYQRAYEKLRDAGDNPQMHKEILEFIAEQMAERYRAAFEHPDDGEKPDVISELQGVIQNVLSSLKRQDLR